MGRKPDEKRELVEGRLSQGSIQKLEHNAQLYGQSKLTLARAARDAGTSIWEMMDFVRRKNIPAQYDLDDFKHDLKILDERL